MAEAPKFTRARIDHHIEKMGFDVRPPIEIGIEKQRVMSFFDDVVKDHPQLFETLSFSRSELSIQKRLDFPGKGQVDVKTFSLTKRGPAFTIPRRLSDLDTETDFDDLDDTIVSVLKVFKKHFVQTQVLRVGKVHEYIFDWETVDSVEFVTKHFTKLNVATEVFVRFNLARDGHNRVFQIQPVVKHQKNGAKIESTGYGISASVDFNNADMSETLDWPRIHGILHEANHFHENEAFDILNNLGGES